MTLPPADRQPASLYGFVWRTTGPWQFAAVFLALLPVILNVVPLELQRRLIDDGILARDLHLLTVIAALFVLVVLIRAAIRFALRLFDGWLSESVILGCRRLIARLHGERTGAGRRETSGTTVSILRAEVEQAGSFTGSAFSDPARHLGLLVGTAGYMLVVEPFVALVGAAFLVPQIALTLAIQPLLNRLTRRG